MSTPAERSTRQHLKLLLRDVRRYLEGYACCLCVSCERHERQREALGRAIIMAKRYGLTPKKNSRGGLKAGQGSAPRAAR